MLAGLETHQCSTTTSPSILSPSPPSSSLESMKKKEKEMQGRESWSGKGEKQCKPMVKLKTPSSTSSSSMIVWAHDLSLNLFSVVISLSLSVMHVRRGLPLPKSCPHEVSALLSFNSLIIHSQSQIKTPPPTHPTKDYMLNKPSYYHCTNRIVVKLF